MSNSIFIFSAAIRSGKTSVLKRWLSNRDDVDGVLTPDVNGLRKLYHIRENKFLPFEVDEAINTYKVGRFLFDIDAFTSAQNILSQCMKKTSGYVIIDEIGPLEIRQNSGFEPQLSALIQHTQNASHTASLILVVRDFLVNEVIEKYQLQHAQVIDKSFFEQPVTEHPTSLQGLILCGGQSVRMGTDKAFITYHHKPQYAHTADLIQPFCKSVWISCNAEQKKRIHQYYPTIIDNATYAGHGPISGLLTAIRELQPLPIMVLGCDYPYLNPSDILALINARTPNHDVVCYKQSNFYEPLLAIYEPSCFNALTEFFLAQHTSLQQFLRTVRIKTIEPNQLKNITSVDKPE